MNYFITGASGFIGHQIVNDLLQDPQANIKALKGRNKDVPYTHPRLQWLDTDLHDTLSLIEDMEDCQYVIHTAAMVSFDPQKRKDMHYINVQGTESIVNAALKSSVIKFCHISSIASLGSSINSNLVDETNKWVNDDKHSNYAISKYLSENEVWRAAVEGLNTVIINPSVVLGAGDWNRSSLKIFQYINQENSYFPKGTLNFVDVRDVSAITIKCLHDENIQNEKFIVNAEAIPYKKAFEIMAHYLKVKAPKKALNKTIGWFAYTISGILRKLKGGEPKVTKDLIQSSRKEIVYSNQKISKLLDYQFKTLEETMKWVAEVQSAQKI